MWSNISTALLLYTTFKTVLAEPTSQQDPPQEWPSLKARASVSRSANTTSTVPSKLVPTPFYDGGNSSVVILNKTLSNDTWYWQDPTVPRVDDYVLALTLNETIVVDENEAMPNGYSNTTDEIDSTWTPSDVDYADVEAAAEEASSRIAATGQRPKVVFAHFMVGNVPTWSVDDWKVDIRKAQAAHIDAFALNMAADDTNNTGTLNMAFRAADDLGFKLVFSFDYAGGGAWDKEVVLHYIDGYAQRPAYYYYNERAFMSTFEGWENAEDWNWIKARINVVFLPDWSSRGAKDAMTLGNGVADGLFSWAAWPWGNTDMNTYVDASYIEFLKGKLYMMPVSPWFYTNMPGFDGKNWLWRGDSLWHDRWKQTLIVQPDFVQIISWNDYGESHYIGPLNDRAYGAFDRGLAPYNYVLDMPHDGWRDLLPYAIDLYKYNTTSFTAETLVSWHRKHPGAACTTGGTSGSTASQLLLEFAPQAVAQDKVFYSALLASDATITVTIGGVNVRAAFLDKPSGGVGLYHGSVATGGRSGAVVISVARSTGSLTVNGKSITTTCEKNIQNWNAWVASVTGPPIASRSPALAVHQMECIAGRGAGIFDELCQFTCKYGYCPLGACQCLALGKPEPKPVSTGIKGYPQIGMSASFEGLCDFGCNLGKCPENVCRTTKVLPYAVWTTSPFLPPACNQGTATGMWAGLCSYACDFGYCPTSVCTCTGQGTLNQPPPADQEVGWPLSNPNDGGLCKFACTRTWCPSDVCFRGTDDTDYDQVDPADYPADCTERFETLDNLVAVQDRIPSHCYEQYMLGIQAKELEVALSDYDKIMSQGYDGKFDTYKQYIADLVWPSIKAFMVGEGKKYLSCTEPSRKPCCKDCSGAWCGACQLNNCVPAGTPVGIICPDKIFSIGEFTTEGGPPAYTFKIENREAFYNDLADIYGIPESWTQIGDHKAYILAGCGENSATCWITWKNVILPAAKIEVPNPKTLFSESLGDLKTLQSTLVEYSDESWISDPAEIIDAVSILVPMASDSVDSMRSVVSTANKIEDTERKEMILFFVESLLMFIPGLGAGASALSTSLRSILRMTGRVGDAAVDLLNVAIDPLSAIVTVFQGILKLKDFTKAARARRGMSSTEIDVLGPRVAAATRRTSQVRTDFYCKT